MDIINELKLAIYESSLEDEYKEDLLNIIESTDDEDIFWAPISNYIRS